MLKTNLLTWACALMVAAPTAADMLPEQVESEDAPVSLSLSMQPLVDHFNAGKGKPRFVAIVSSTCPACVFGAKAVKESVLDVLDRAEVVIPAATRTEKSGTFENVHNRLQAFERAINPIDFCKGEAQIALDLTAAQAGETPTIYNPVATRQEMADVHDLKDFLAGVHLPAVTAWVESDMQIVEV